jgi:bifunctional ADP-heptose synthase (sugar kinase/adenylyltransferase)
MKVLILGDMIHDVYRHFTASRLCPEAPVPVLIKEKKYSSAGGAGLVAGQFTALTNDVASAVLLAGSYSQKERVFADDRLMVRMDDDSSSVLNTGEYLTAIETHLLLHKPDAVVVSDYHKGALTADLASWLVHKVNELGIPLFVDAKKTWHYYRGVFAIFPNQQEPIVRVAKHTVQKLGAEGCRVDGVDIPQHRPHAVRDVTGAGDCFLAAFVYKFLENKHWFSPACDESVNAWALQNCARFANKVAGISVEYVGTHVVTQKELETKLTNQ